MINFKKIPITLWQPSQIDMNNLPELQDGIHFYIHCDLNQETYDEVLNGIHNNLHKGINVDNHTGTGVKYPFPLTHNIYNIMSDCRQLNDYYNDHLYQHGFNPIRVKYDRLLIWGQQFVYRGKTYPYVNMLEPTLNQNWRPANLIMLAHQFDANVTTEHLGHLHEQRVHLLSKLEEVTLQLGWIERQIVLQQHELDSI